MNPVDIEEEMFQLKNNNPYPYKPSTLKKKPDQPNSPHYGCSKCGGNPMQKDSGWRKFLKCKRCGEKGHVSKKCFSVKGSNEPTREWNGIRNNCKAQCRASKQIYEPWSIAPKQVIWWVNWVTSSSKQQQLFNSTRCEVRSSVLIFKSLCLENRLKDSKRERSVHYSSMSSFSAVEYSQPRKPPLFTMWSGQRPAQALCTGQRN